MNEAFFSICLPVYNGSPYIGTAVNSVLQQTFEDWELVIYNNGSVDGTSGILKNYSDPRIRVTENSQKALRAIPAWHRTMTMGRGKYVLMLGHDDWFKPEFLKTAHQYIHEYDLDVFSGWMECYDPEYRFVEVVTCASFIQSIPRKTRSDDLIVFDGKGYIQGFVHDFSNGFSKMHLSTTWMRRALYEKVGGFNSALEYCAESELYLKLAHAGARFGFLWGHPLANYIGVGPQRRAGFLDAAKRYHDFYRIPKIMQETGMVDAATYQGMLSSVNRQAALQGRGYPLSAALSYNSQYNEGTQKLLWAVFLTAGWFWSRLRRTVDYLFEKSMGYVTM